MSNEKSNYWLDIAVKAIVSKFGAEEEIVISSGISPSASYHIGHFREILTADALAWGLKRIGVKARHIHVVDNFDPLRRRYDFLPESYEQYVGQPICLIPDPFLECKELHKTYAEHYYQEFEVYAQQMGIHPDRVVRSYEDLYMAGKMTDRIEEVLEKQKEIIKIFESVSNRKLDDAWTGVMVLDENNKFNDAKMNSWDRQQRTINGIKYNTGRAKLTWRLDWPGRWKVLGVMVEPFSKQEHGAAGGSYDTGKLLAKNIFNIVPPMPGAEYGNVHMIGDSKKMSSSKGNLVTPKQALEIMPHEILRYYMVRSRPDKTLYFDSGEGMYNLVDEFSKVAMGENAVFQEAYDFAISMQQDQNAGGRIVSSVSFKHLVAVYQSALKSPKNTLDILARTGYEKSVSQEKEVIEEELKFIDYWLNEYAPDSVKFELQQKVPNVELSDAQKAMLKSIANKIEDESVSHDGQWFHGAIHSAREAYGLEPKEAFQAIYRVLLGRDLGPRAGWFLSILDEQWLVNRLKLEA